MKKLLLSIYILSLLVGMLAIASADDPWTPQEDYDDTFFITHNGLPHLSAQMSPTMIGAGFLNHLGHGQYVKNGIATALYYTRYTKGIEDDWNFYVLDCPESYSSYLPPDVTSKNDLPAEIVTKLPLWAFIEENRDNEIKLGHVPRFLADIEWARYSHLPVSIQIQVVGPQGGSIVNGDLEREFDMTIYFETRTENGTGDPRDNCMWDLSDRCDEDDDPTTYDGQISGAFGNFSFATPTNVDPDIALEMGYILEYKSYCERNLKDGISEVLEIFSLPRYAGRLVAFAYNPEMYHTAFFDDQYLKRHFITDYHPANCRAFGYYLRDRYGDVSPIEDSNGDGLTFKGDFGNEYRLTAKGIMQPYPPIPDKWEDIQPPRKQVHDPEKPHKGRYWQEWCNYRTRYMEDWLEDEGEWIRSCGVPAERIFTHQVGIFGSRNADRANPAHPYEFHEQGLQCAGEEQLSDWIHVEMSGGYSGLSLYTPYEIIAHENDPNPVLIAHNLWCRDESFGIPEFNPGITGGLEPAPEDDVYDALTTVYDLRGHVIWPNAWASTNHPVFDCTSARWESENGPFLYTDWTMEDLIPHGNRVRTTSGNASLISPDLTDLNLILGYASHFVSLIRYDYDGPDPDPNKINDVVSWKVMFLFTDQGETFIEDQSVIGYARYGGPLDVAGQKEFSINLGESLGIHPEWYHRQIKRIKYIPVLNETDVILWFNHMYFALDNAFSTGLRVIASEYEDDPRPDLVETLDISLPFKLEDQIENNQYVNFICYGNEQHSDFNWVGHFYKTTGVCGGDEKSAISAAPPTPLDEETFQIGLLGARRVGKYRRLRLPETENHLLFRTRLGIADGNQTYDGVAFRIYIRTEDRLLHTILEKEWRWNAWSDEFTADLSAYAGQVIDLYLETRGIADATGDAALWGEPRIIEMHPQHNPKSVTVTFHDGTDGVLEREQGPLPPDVDVAVDYSCLKMAEDSLFVVPHEQYDAQKVLFKVTGGLPDQAYVGAVLRADPNNHGPWGPGTQTYICLQRINQQGEAQIKVYTYSDLLEEDIELAASEVLADVNVAGDDFVFKVAAEGTGITCSINGIDVDLSNPVIKQPAEGGFTSLAASVESNHPGTIRVEYFMVRAGNDIPDVTFDSQNNFWISLAEDDFINNFDYPSFFFVYNGTDMDYFQFLGLITSPDLADSLIEETSHSAGSIDEYYILGFKDFPYPVNTIGLKYRGQHEEEKKKP